MKRWMPQLIATVALLSIGWFAHSAFSGGNSMTPGGSSRGGMSRGGRPPATGSFGYPGATKNPAADVQPVEVTSSMLAVIRERVRGSGILEPEREVSLLSRVEGSVDEVMVEEGQEVKESKILCSIDQEELKISANLARIEMDKSQATFDRLMGLTQIGRSDQELEDARFALEKSKANHSRALLDLGHSQPTALFDGIIIRRRVEPGQYVRVGDELFAFADFHPLRVRLYLPESEVADVELGQRCVLKSESDGQVLTEGTVERISPVVDRNSLTVEVLASFPDAGLSLRPGSFVHVDIITRILENRIVVPRKAVLRSDGRSRIFRLLEDGETVQEIEVVTGYENEAIIVCEEGLALGDQVVIQGLEDLKDHDRVSVWKRERPIQVDALTVERIDGGEAPVDRERVVSPAVKKDRGPGGKRRGPGNGGPQQRPGRGPQTTPNGTAADQGTTGGSSDASGGSDG